MSAPPLPEVFGNYALGDFVEVVPPEAISWLPQTVGWRILAVLLLGFALYRGWHGLRRWYRNRYRREAGNRLQAMEEAGQGALLAGDINKLLKLAALAAFPREQVAALHGSRCTTPPFGATQIQLLAVGSYRAVPVDDAVRRDLLAASLTWVREHENPRDD